MTVDTSQGIQYTAFTISVEIGSQTAVSPPISVEVYNCFAQLTFASDLKIQVGSVTQIFNAIAANRNPLDC